MVLSSTHADRKSFRWRLQEGIHSENQTPQLLRFQVTPHVCLVFATKRGPTLFDRVTSVFEVLATFQVNPSALGEKQDEALAAGKERGSSKIPGSAASF